MLDFFDADTVDLGFGCGSMNETEACEKKEAKEKQNKDKNEQKKVQNHANSEIFTEITEAGRNLSLNKQKTLFCSKETLTPKLQKA